MEKVSYEKGKHYLSQSSWYHYVYIYRTSVASLRKENQKRLNHLHQIDIKNVA
jgi:hypothetical protein